VLYLGHPSAAQTFKVYIATDMEGCSGITGSEQVAAEEGKQLMAGDMNACIEGCFAAGQRKSWCGIFTVVVKT